MKMFPKTMQTVAWHKLVNHIEVYQSSEKPEKMQHQNSKAKHGDNLLKAET
jgi:hypothetical protein